MAVDRDLFTVERAFSWDRSAHGYPVAWAVIVTWTAERRRDQLVWSPTRVAVDGGGVPVSGLQMSAAPVAEAIEATALATWPLDTATPLGEIMDQLGALAYNTLMRAGITTVEQLTVTSEERIRELPRMGQLTRQQVAAALTHYWGAPERSRSDFSTAAAGGGR